MRHTYECPMRWADMDLLGHVNNVTYLDYLAAARDHLFAGLPAARAAVTGHRVEFRRPLVFHRQPVLVDTWVTGVDGDRLALAHEVYDAAEDGRTVYLRASTTLAHGVTEAESDLVERHSGPDHEWRPLEAIPGRPRDVYRAQVRRSDLGPEGTVSDVAHVEYFQEARIQYLMNLHTRGQSWSHHVVARTDVEYLAPVPDRQAAYDVHSWVGHLGGRSFTVQAELVDGDRVLARADVVMVTFDRETQRPTDMTESQRTRLREEVPPSAHGSA